MCDGIMCSGIDFCTNKTNAKSVQSDKLTQRDRVLKFLDFHSHNFRVLFLKFFSAGCLVVKCAIVFVCVAVEGTKQLSTTTVKPWRKEEGEVQISDSRVA